MKLILIQQVEKLGALGDVVEVKEGYGRNFLIPRNLALPATEANIREVELQKRRETVLKENEKKAAEGLAEKLSAVSLTIPVEVGEDDRLFGSVTPINIVKAIEEEGVEINKRSILLEEPIKKLGAYEVQLKLHPEVTTTLKVQVVKK